MLVDLQDCDSLLQKAVTEIIWEYHQHRLRTQDWYREIHDQLGAGVTMGKEFMMMNITSYMYTKYNLIVSEQMGYRIETSYSSDGTVKRTKTVPEIQGISFSSPNLSDEQVLDRIFEIAREISKETP